VTSVRAITVVTPRRLRASSMRVERIDGTHVYIGLVGDVPMHKKAKRRVFKTATGAQLYAITALARYIRLWDASQKDNKGE
jgi:hypothetical protein